MSDDIGGVCVVTQPQRNRSEKNHAFDLATIIAEITAVAVLTANLPSDSPLRDEHDVVEFSARGTGDRVLVEALRFMRNQIRLCRAIARRDERVVLFFGTTSYVLPVVVSRLLGKTVVVLPRGDVPLSLRLRWEQTLPSAVARVLAGTVSLLERRNYRLADAIVTYTPAMADQLGLDRDAGKLYPNGARFVDVDAFDVHVPFEDRGETVGFVGRLDVEKRVPAMAEAVGRLPESVRFVFVGDGDYRETLKADLATEIDAGQVEVVGWVDREDLPEQFNRFRLLVVPSYPTEGLPTVILEAMACGTPVIATPVSGVPDVVREGETGFLMDRSDPRTIESTIRESLAAEPLAEMSRNCRAEVESNFSFDAAVARYRTILTAIEDRSDSTSAP